MVISINGSGWSGGGGGGSSSNTDQNLIIDQLINELLQVMSDDMLDKTKCSVTSKNIYNYVIKKYGTPGFQTILWNDTLQNNFSSLKDVMNMSLEDLSNKIAYVYFDHICGETSHYFIMIFNKNGDFYLLQSAVFEYSLSCWTMNISNEDVRLLQYGPKESKDKDRYETLVRINNNIPARRTRNAKEFFEQLQTLEGSWIPPIDDKCKLFEQLFACKMDPEKYNKYFKQEEQTNNKEGMFRFRFSRLINVE